MTDIESLVSKINAEIQRIKDADFKTITQYQRLQQNYAQIIVPTGRKHSGYIRSYENLVESVQRYNKKRQGKNKITPISKEEYEQQVLELYEKHKTDLNYETYLESVKEGFIKIIYEYFAELGMDAKMIQKQLNDMTVQQLRDIFKEVKRKSISKRNDKNYDSENFKTKLADELYSYLVSNNLI